VSLCLCGFVFFGGDAFAQDVRFEQRLNEQAPLDLSFCDEKGRAVRFGDLLGGKPAILALVYYRCPMACPLVLNALALSLKSLSLKPGSDFTVVTVSFDPSDTPAMAAQRRAEALARCRRPEVAEGWRFLTGNESAARALCRSVGFHYTADPATGQFSHPTGIVVLTGEGRVSKYVLGAEYPPSDLRLSLVEASKGKIGSIVDGIYLLCARYDPTSGRYGIAVVTWVRGGGVATLLALACYIVWARSRERRRASEAR
jgi:protein SCO1/2